MLVQSSKYYHSLSSIHLHNGVLVPRLEIFLLDEQTKALQGSLKRYVAIFQVDMTFLAVHIFQPNHIKNVLGYCTN